VGAALAAAVILAPWLVWLPLVSAPATTVLLGALAIVCSLHGWGCAVAWLSRRDDAGAALVAQWGLAAVIAAGGLLLACGLYNARLLLITGGALHSASIALRGRALADELADACTWRRMRFWLVPGLALGAFSLIAVLAAAGASEARMFDDQSNVLGQLARLASTGGLADPIGFPRDTQLGGHLTLGALVTPFGDPSLVRLVDRGVGFALVVWLAWSRLRPRDGGSALWCTLLVLVAASFRVAGADLLPFWLSAGLLLAMYTTAESAADSARGLIPTGLLAGAACSLRLELVPAVVALLVLAWLRQRRHGRVTAGHVLALLATPVAVVGVYLLARHGAWTHVGAGAHAVVSPRPWVLMLRFTSQLVWPAAAAALVIVATRAAVTPTRTAMVVALLSCVLVVEAQRERGSRAWAWRVYDTMFDVQYVRDFAPVPDPYANALTGVPAGARVAVWVAHPEQLEYRGHVVFDLRTPRVVRLADPKKPERLASAVRATGARWLLVDAAEETRFAALAGTRSHPAGLPGVVLVDLR
jgi:hypothetical protein